MRIALQTNNLIIINWKNYVLLSLAIAVKRRKNKNETAISDDISNRSRISFEMIGSRRPKIHPVIDGQKVISHRARQRVILHGGEGGSRVGDSHGGWQ